MNRYRNRDHYNNRFEDRPKADASERRAIVIGFIVMILLAALAEWVAPR